MKTCKKLLAITIALVLLVSTLVSGLVVSAAEVGTLVLTSQPITESDADQTVTVDLTFDYTEAVAAPHNLVTLSTDSTFVLESIVVTSVNGIAASEYDTETDPEGEVSANPCPIYIKENGINLSEGKFILEAITVDSNSIEDVVITATYTIPANTVAGKYPVTATADYTDYYECDDTLGITNGEIVIKAAHEHAAKDLVNNEDGTHTVKCECGETIETVKCVYENGECACGAKEPVYEDANLKIRGAGITMANGFALDFKVRKTMETSLGYSDIYIEFQKPRYDIDGNIVETRTTVVAVDARTNDPTNSENYLYTLEGIQPQEVGTTITATIYGTKEGHVYKGATVEYSVLKFTTNQLKTLTESSTATALQTTCADIIMYGAAVQEYAKYNTANPIIDAADVLCGSTVWQGFATAEITRELVNAQTNTPLDGATVRVRSAGVTLSSKVILYFNCADMGVTTLAEPNNYVVRVSYKNVEGIDRTYDLEINDAYQAELDTLYSTELGTVVTACMVDKATDTVVSNTVTYSIETFLSKNLTNATMGGWCKALEKYGDSVRAYAGLN